MTAKKVVTSITISAFAELKAILVDDLKEFLNWANQEN